MHQVISWLTLTGIHIRCTNQWYHAFTNPLAKCSLSSAVLPKYYHHFPLKPCMSKYRMILIITHHAMPVHKLHECRLGKMFTSQNEYIRVAYQSQLGLPCSQFRIVKSTSKRRTPSHNKIANTFSNLGPKMKCEKRNGWMWDIDLTNRRAALYQELMNYYVIGASD